MGILSWILFGGLAGWIASAMTEGGYGIVGGILLGILGAFVGGFVANLFGEGGVSGFNLYSLAVAVGGSLLVLFVARKVF